MDAARCPLQVDRAFLVFSSDHRSMLSFRKRPTTVPAAPAAASEPATPPTYTAERGASMVALLEALRASRALLTVHCGTDTAFFLSTLLGLERDALLLDLGTDRDRNAQLLSAARLRIETHEGPYAVAFVTGPAQLDAHRDAPAFRVPMPELVHREQRRAFYRVHVPLARPAFCYLAVAAAEAPAGTLQGARVLDISCGGLALVDVPPGVPLAEGAQFEGCRVDLPGEEPFKATVEIVRVYLNVRGRPRCVGAGRFVGLTERELRVLQRYIYRLDRDQRRRT